MDMETQKLCARLTDDDLFPLSQSVIALFFHQSVTDRK